jgi:hypothetical protein
VTDLVDELGFENVYVQELSVTAEFVPDFTEDQPFAGNR